MYKKLLEFLKRKPPVYAESTAKFWDDEHISKYMLEAHLNPDIDAASRRHSFIEASARWIGAVSGQSRPLNLLDLGCGAGLYAEAFAAMGFRVTGIDFAKRSVAYAKEQAALKHREIVYHYQNYLDIAYESEFDVITLIFCDFGVLKPADRASLLKKVKKALKPGGMLVLDGFTERQYADFAESKTVEYEDGGFWSAAPYACLKNCFRYDDSKVYLEQYVIVTEESCECYNIWNQAFDEASLSDALQRAGFTEYSFYGNARGENVSEADQTLCVVAK